VIELSGKRENLRRNKLPTDRAAYRWGGALASLNTFHKRDDFPVNCVTSTGNIAGDNVGYSIMEIKSVNLSINLEKGD
jgi:hypothetical protein